MPNYIIFSICSTILFAILVLIQKYAITGVSKNPFVLAFYTGVFSIIFVPFIWLFVPFQFSTDILLSLLLSSFLFFIANALLYVAFSKLDASVSGSLFPLKMIFVPVLAVLFLNEQFTTSIYIWIGLATIGAIISSYDENLKMKSFFSIGTFIMLCSMFIFTVSDIFASRTISTIGPWNFQAWFTISIGVFSFLLLPVIKKDLRIKKKFLWSIPVISFILFSAVVLLFISFRDNITITNAITTLGRIPIILGATAFLSSENPKLLEYHPKKVYIIRSIGAFVIIVAVLQIILTL